MYADATGLYYCMLILQCHIVMYADDTGLYSLLYAVKMKREPLLAKIRFSKSAKEKFDHMISPLSINMGAYQKK